ncbi:patatin-like phospholipase family protein [Flavihumibacter fluvii]|uniref:patatin-like phospholipase family protein n=1 Tax=Flavihumibacter fluvii TaxID=2838157 RepID=UPI001BDE07D8|nr:patatin-like phospholipase family protein [Flavihumibacter fluvii]ULQ51531.1 patatin-like phospholipase family protein [Flavihumibacter fluvii]
MKQKSKAIFYSFAVQLILLHFKKFQILLVFWFILFGAVNGSFMSSFGVNSLFLSPEYMGNVNALSAGIVGMAIGIFIMSWNITTFILFSRHFRFLATTTRPFLKYCINNAVLPLVFLLFYFFRAVRFDSYKELMGYGEVLSLVIGFIIGLVFIVAISFGYFFGADMHISRNMINLHPSPIPFHRGLKPHIVLNSGGSRLIKVTTYLSGRGTVKAVRDVAHYSKDFLENIFNRHHFTAVLSIFIAFVFLMLIGFLLDYEIFQLPAAASITLFLAILVAVVGAFSYFLQSWSVPFALLLIILLNILYRNGIIDPTNKAYGLDYRKEIARAAYTPGNLQKLNTPEKIAADKAVMLGVLEKWKARQTSPKPFLYMVAVSGGGTRSATFTMGVLQKLDSISGGKFMRQTFMITGASGGMLGAAYFRALSHQKDKGEQINLQDPAYIDDISKDLLNPTFSSFVARDLAAPAQKFKVGNYEYVKDRAYSFEQKLNQNTRFLLDKELSELAADERSAVIPNMLFNAVITRDGRKMLISTLPVSFLMQPGRDARLQETGDPDAIDFAALFEKQDPMNLRLLTALRMNATFPYVLPNVWLPTEPTIDVMDAGLRDNYGLETSLRFINVFKDWIKENTSGVVLLQIRDRRGGGWEYPFESKDISEVVTKPLLLLQYNWYKMQQFNQAEQLNLTADMLGGQFHKITFQYIPAKEDTKAALNFHLTKQEKRDIVQALDNDLNKQGYQQFRRIDSTSVVDGLDELKMPGQ